MSDWHPARFPLKFPFRFIEFTRDVDAQVSLSKAAKLAQSTSTAAKLKVKSVKASSLEVASIKGARLTTKPSKGAVLAVEVKR